MNLHHSFAYVVVACAVALLAVSVVAKVKRGVLWAAIPFILIAAQFFLAFAAYSNAIVGVLHGLNALAIFAVALLAGHRVPKTAPIAEQSAQEDVPVIIGARSGRMRSVPAGGAHTQVSRFSAP
ncbi:MAG: hypothetical protein ACTHMP_20050 [Thermomicrobiales bacterium]